MLMRNWIFILFLFRVILFPCLSFSQGSDPQRKHNTLPMPLHSAPVPEFSVLNYCYGDTTYFINQTILNFKPNWTIFHFVGKALDTIYVSPHKDLDTNIAFKFPAIGTYSVTLSADNGHYMSITKEIIVDTVIHASFSFQQCADQFTNTSCCATGYYWDFGDGKSSNSEFPIHQYADTGWYVVKLIASNGSKADTLIQNIYVYSYGIPNPIFSFSQSLDTVFVHSIETKANHYWNFGDGTFAAGQDTMHVYNDTGNYIITLVVVNMCGNNSQFQDVDIIFPKNGIEALTSSIFSLLVYPNPVINSNVIGYTIYSNKPIGAAVSVYDVTGKKLIESPTRLNSGLNTELIGVSDLHSGIYNLLINAAENGKCHALIIVQKGE